MRFRSKPPHSSSPLILALALSLLIASGVRAQSVPETHAKVQLVPEEKSIRPGGTFWVGILFQLDPGWHIYWQNPGDSGEPPKIEWQLPPGFRAGAIRWPLPVLLGKGSVRDYGYEDRVLLMAPLRTPSNLSATAPVKIIATVKYIVCREFCIPGGADLTLSIPPLSQASVPPSPWRDLFQKTRAQQPEPLPRNWKVSATSTGGNLVLMLEGTAATHQMRFFPLDAGVIENSAPQSLTSNGRVIRLTLKKSEQMTMPVSTLRGVIVIGANRAYKIDVPVGMATTVD